MCSKGSILLLISCMLCNPVLWSSGTLFKMSRHSGSPAGLCRYHYNVGSTRLDVHVKKGLADGLYISSVGCTSDLWGIIMDAGTGFSQQLYRVVPDAFLPKEWIMEKWDLGYYITAVAGWHLPRLLPRLSSLANDVPFLR